ncbi:disulfide bond formation protein B [Sulfitobacter geojensis]|uniref:Disulfide bond formation protein B n=1 Tax=Sulfitobacter geojensis TaxID=1342299 RepID=A0AAE2W1F0_9RHOB|nr:disulfide bond formation protein B [Sulfitobacter geojensis]MBM1691395.1 disulfide bond formation protein B [Sulfitobacter geojensis]MBM1695461.1 disulfide bond formation protein B [Sulfitobacter geojensis]MBM1707649.1 disulfide bond formation protein B [Sulfitobacter geojensis]MBM1711711.1 disulfide bond formation protein B [Sulfitobacter geojensis]MBM1715774.1 disulfide bond formation protein B [Sulfitobacter geojensis]
MFAAWFLSLAASLSVLFISEVLGQSPCHLCWLQRAFMFPLAVILGIAAWRSDLSIWRYAVPLAVIGGAIALYHWLLYAGVLPEPITPCTASGPSCTDDAMLILGLPIPALSFLTFGVISALLLQLRRIAS